MNDVRYKIEVPEEGKREREREGGGEKGDVAFVPFTFLVYSVPLDGEKSLSDVKNMIYKLYTSLSVDRHQVIGSNNVQVNDISLSLSLSLSFPPLSSVG